MNNLIERYNAKERRNHWLVAILFFLAAFSGLSLFHPSMFWLTNFFGGGPWTRILHPFMGLAMFLFFLGLMLRFWHHNKLSDNDKKWLKQWKDVMNNDEHKLPEVGRYNGGQKMLFWVMVICMITLLVTGLMFWRGWPNFASYFGIGLIRLATLLHAIAATLLIVGIIVHVYAAIWVKGTIGAMTRGFVTHKWASKHHAGWYRELTKRS
jgi:formate dehydrogenase subunit gamma